MTEQGRTYQRRAHKRTARLVVYDDETHLVLGGSSPGDGHAFAVGEKVPVVRGNGPRKGQRMATARVTGDEDGIPLFKYQLGGEVFWFGGREGR